MRPIRVSDDLLVLAATQYGLVSAGECERFGVRSGSRSALVRAGLWTRVTRGVYDVAATAAHQVPWAHRHQRAAVAGLLAYGPDAVAVGGSALALHGVAGLPATVRPEVALPGGRSAQDRRWVRLRQFDAGMEVTRVGRWAAATVVWALAQAVPELDRSHAVALMDSAQFLRLLDEDGLAYAHGLAHRRRRVERTHPWWELSDGRAESPNETRVRLDCLDCGVAPDDLQVRVCDGSGRLIGRGDLGWRRRDGRWLIGEVDGEEVHGAVPALFHDRDRQNRFLANGADTVRFTWRDTRVAGRCGGIIRGLLAADHGLPATSAR